MSGLASALHIFPDPMAAGYFRQTNKSSEVIYLQDNLSLGPILPLDDETAWLVARESFYQWLQSDLEYVESLVKFEHNLITMQRHKNALFHAPAIVLWVGPSLAEQLFLLWCIALLERFGIDLGKLYLVEMAYLKGRYIQHIWLAFPNEGQIGIVPKRITNRRIHLAQKAWKIVSSPYPLALIKLSQRDFEIAPQLVISLTRLRLRYPQCGSGLSRFDQTLL